MLVRIRVMPMRVTCEDHRTELARIPRACPSKDTMFLKSLLKTCVVLLTRANLGKVQTQYLIINIILLAKTTGLFRRRPYFELPPQLITRLFRTVSSAYEHQRVRVVSLCDNQEFAKTGSRQT